VTAPRAQVVVIGSGAGGAVTALELAERGFDVTVLEEGPRLALEDYGSDAATAMARLYRRRGMTPLLGRVPIAFAEAALVGGSTEVNSGFWTRTPPETMLRWRSQHQLADATGEDLAPHFEWAERLLGVGEHAAPWPPSTTLFARGAEAMGWAAREVPRAARGCAHSNTCASGCARGAKQGVTRALLPRAETAGAKILSGHRALLLLREGRRARGVLCERRHPDGSAEIVRVAADQVFVCGGPTQTPALLRRSGIKLHVGDTFQIHPMLKVVARFPQVVDAHRSVLPLVQVREFAPDLALGGAFFTPGHLALVLGENGAIERMDELRHLAMYYVAVRGTGAGWVRPSIFGDHTTLRYQLSRQDVRGLSVGLARLSMLLFAAGATEILPSVSGVPPLKSAAEAAPWLDAPLPARSLNLTTVHAFSSCPIGERRDRCAADSFGKLFVSDNVYINDASMLPDSPGVNPQASIMALARRNAIRFAETARG
jgi:choline dehydrogenase-like flavoprotein